MNSIHIHFMWSQDKELLQAALTYKVRQVSTAGLLRQGKGTVVVEASMHAHDPSYEQMSVDVPRTSVWDNETFQVDTDEPKGPNGGAEVQDKLLPRILVRFGIVPLLPMSPGEAAAERLHLRFVSNHLCIVRVAIQHKLEVAIVPAIREVGVDQPVQIKVSRHKGQFSYVPESTAVPRSGVLRTEMFEMGPEAIGGTDEELEQHLMERITAHFDLQGYCC